MSLEYIIYVVDTETTGLDHIKNDVIEISMCRITISDEIKREQKTWLLRALNAEAISDEALQINEHKREDILCLTKVGKENYREPSEVIIEIEKWVAEDNVSVFDRVFVGQNPLFDVNFLKELWKKAGSSDTFPFMLDSGTRILDVKQIATLVDLCTGHRRRYYNLSTLVKSFGIKKAKAHTAAGDVQMTTDLLLTMLEPFISIILEKFKHCYSEQDM